MEENIDIEEDVQPKRNNHPGRGKPFGDAASEITEMFGVTESELESAMEKFAQMLNSNSDPDFLEELSGHMMTSGNGNEKHFSLDNIGLKMVLDKFLGGNHTPDMSKMSPNAGKNPFGNMDELLEKMQEDLGIPDDEMEETTDFVNKLINLLSGGAASDEDVEKLLGIASGEEDELFDDGEEQMTSYDFDIIADNESFGAIVYIPSEHLYDEFKDIYGEGPYNLQTFVATKGYNLIPAFSTMDTLTYIGNNEKYILFLAQSNDESIEDFVVAAIKSSEEVFDFIVPEYGNTFNIESGDAINKVLDTDMYREVKDDKGNISLELTHPLDVDRVRGSLDLLLYEDKEPLLSAHDFGEIFASPTPSVFNSDFIRVGRIKCNNSKEANLFKMHCDLDEDKEFFDFYVRLSDELPVRTLDAIQKYFEHIDFNNNPKIAKAELKTKNYESVYIDLDLGGLEGFARFWVE
jgi:hypothetical protein